MQEQEILTDNQNSTDTSKTVDGPSDIELETRAAKEKQVQFAVKLSTRGKATEEQVFVSPTIPDATEGILEIVRESLLTGVVPNGQLRIKLYGVRGTKIVHLLNEINIETRPARYADYA